MSSLIDSVLELLPPCIACATGPVIIISEQTRRLLHAAQEHMWIFPCLLGHYSLSAFRCDELTGAWCSVLGTTKL
jgi:hypothetical protein